MVKHLACIMDGNRRWAAKQGLPSFSGHSQGLEAIKNVIRFCLEKKITYLSLWAFSIDNFKRSVEEQAYLFDVLSYQAAQEFSEFNAEGVHIRFIGDRTLFPKGLRSLCEKIERDTIDGNVLFINFLLCYSGQQEIVDATKRIAIKIKKGDLQESDITPALFEHFLWTGAIPSPDLIIRTGGHHRLSNFLLYQIAYSELYFTDCLWPDITDIELTMAINYFNECQKNFGQ